MKILIKNGRVIDPASDQDGQFDVLVKDGKISKVEKNIEKSVLDDGDTYIDAKGLVVTPGLIDIQVHLREPGREDRETIETGCMSALAGGVTSVVAMPNVTPAADTQTVIEFIVNRAEKLNLANVYPAAAITRGQNGEYLADMWETKNSGAICVTDDGFDVQDESMMLRAMKYAKTHDIVMMCHSEYSSLTEEGVMHEGWVSTQLGLPAHPEITEDMAVRKNIMLAEKSGVKLHLLHVSTKGAVQAVREAKARGMKNLTAETCPQYFSVTDEECFGYNTNAKMYPPLRSDDHVKAIIQGLKDGTIDAISTDHAPHIEPDKLKPFQDAAMGSVGLETSFAVGNTYLVNEKKLSLKHLVEKMTIGAAKIVRLDKGTLKKGKDADIAIFDVNKKWTVDANEFKTKGRNCVFNGKKLVGKAMYTIVSGQVKMEKGEIIS